MHRFFNWFWGMLGAYTFISGPGLALCGLSMIDLGYDIGGIILICIGVPLTYIGYRLEKKVRAANKAERSYSHKASV